MVDLNRAINIQWSLEENRFLKSTGIRQQAWISNMKKNTNFSYKAFWTTMAEAPRMGSVFLWLCSSVMLLLWAKFADHNLQEWSKIISLLRLWLANVLRPTAACNICSALLPQTSEPVALESLLFDHACSTKRFKCTASRAIPIDHACAHLSCDFFFFDISAEGLDAVTFHKSDIWLPIFHWAYNLKPQHDWYTQPMTISDTWQNMCPEFVISQFHRS